jgi:hypothetical protein
MMKSFVSVPEMMSPCLKSHGASVFAKTGGDLVCTHETNKSVII